MHVWILEKNRNKVWTPVASYSPMAHCFVTRKAACDHMESRKRVNPKRKYRVQKYKPAKNLK